MVNGVEQPTKSGNKEAVEVLHNCIQDDDLPMCQTLLAKICLSIFIVIESALCINLKVVNFDKLYVKADERDQI